MSPAEQHHTSELQQTLVMSFVTAEQLRLVQLYRSVSAHVDVLFERPMYVWPLKQTTNLRVSWLSV